MGDNQWEIIEHFEHPSQEAMLNALIRGTNALSLQVAEPLNEEKFRSLFQDIDLSIINLYLDGEAQAIASFLRDGMNATIPLEVFEKYDSSSSAQLSAHLFTIENDEFQKEAEHFLNIAKDHLDKPLAITCKVDGNYLQNIIHLRVIRLLWKHMKASSPSAASTLKIIAETKKYPKSTALEEDIIFASIHLMSSVIGSADSILLKTSDKGDKSEDFKRRITRNLHHLASYEGKMDMQHDPLSGSYFIEKETLALAKSIWNKFKA